LRKYVDEIFRTKVPADVLEKVVAAFAAMDPVDRSNVTGRAIRVARVLHEEGLLGHSEQ